MLCDLPSGTAEKEKNPWRYGGISGVRIDRFPYLQHAWNCYFKRSLPSDYFFLLGHVLYVYRDRVPVDWRLFVLSLAGHGSMLCAVLVDGGCLDLLSVCASLSGIYGETVWQQTCLWGTFSYTIYLCAFPIQQLLIHLFGGQMNVYLHMGLALVIATAVGVVLHYTTEK